MATWGDLFDRAAREADDVDVERVRERLRTRRSADPDSDGADAADPSTGESAHGSAGDQSAGDGSEAGGRSEAPPESPGPGSGRPAVDPTRVVADADVLVADLLVGGAARDALDCLRRHSWTTLLASDPLLADARRVAADLTSPALADDWRDRVDDWRERVVHPAGDHPGLASAYRGGAAHLLSFDPELGSARTGLSVQPYAALSVRAPDAFATVFDAAGLYATGRDGDPGDAREYPGPDRDPRA